MSVAVWWKDYVSDDHLRRSVVHHAWVVETDLAVPALRHVDVIGTRSRPTTSRSWRRISGAGTRAWPDASW